MTYEDYKPRRALVDSQVGDRRDAKNRALRTLAQGLLTDIAIAALLFLFPIFGTTATDWSTLDWQLVGLTLIKTIVATALSYFMRLFRLRPKSITV